MNPTISEDFISAEYERDPISAAAEYGAQFRSDVDAFIRADVVEDAVVSGRYELAPSPKSYKYHGFADPVGGRAIVSRLAFRMARATLPCKIASESLSRHFRLKLLFLNSQVCYVLMA